MPSTPQSFFESLRAAHAAADAEAYVDLFDLPSVSYVEGGPQTLLHEADLRARLDALVVALRDLGVAGHDVEYRSIRPYAAHLLGVRAAVRLRLEDGLTTDEREEYWVLRERDGVLRLCLTVNSTAGNLVEGGDGVLREGDGTPAGASDAAAAFLAAMQESFNRRDVAAHTALLDDPFLRVADERTECFRRSHGEVARTAGFFDAVNRAGVAGLNLSPMAERPYGRDYAVLRVQVVVVFEDGRRADPYEELWVLRQVDGRLRLGAIVNPLAHRFLAQDLPLRRPT